MNGEVNLSALETEFDKNELRFLLTHACSRWCHLSGEKLQRFLLLVMDGHPNHSLTRTLHNKEQPQKLQVICSNCAQTVY